MSVWVRMAVGMNVSVVSRLLISPVLAVVRGLQERIGDSDGGGGDDEAGDDGGDGDDVDADSNSYGGGDSGGASASAQVLLFACHLLGVCVAFSGNEGLA